MSIVAGYGPCLLISDPIDSTRHGVRLRYVVGWLHEDEPEAIVAKGMVRDRRFRHVPWHLGTWASKLLRGTIRDGFW